MSSSNLKSLLKIVEELTFTLPKIPQLLGEENLEEWKAAIHSHFEWYDIIQCLTDDIPEPPADVGNWR